MISASCQFCLTYLFRLCFTGYFQIFVSLKHFGSSWTSIFFAFLFDCVSYIHKKKQPVTFSQQLRLVWVFHSTASNGGSQHVGLHFHGICPLFFGFTSHSPPGNRGVPCWPCDIGPQTGLTFLLLQFVLSFVPS